MVRILDNLKFFIRNVVTLYLVSSGSDHLCVTKNRFFLKNSDRNFLIRNMISFKIEHHGGRGGGGGVLVIL